MHACIHQANTNTHIHISTKTLNYKLAHTRARAHTHTHTMSPTNVEIHANSLPYQNYRHGDCVCVSLADHDKCRHLLHAALSCPFCEAMFCTYPHRVMHHWCITNRNMSRSPTLSWLVFNRVMHHWCITNRNMSRSPILSWFVFKAILMVRAALAVYRISKCVAC